jgi:hypothetical protein
MRKYDGELDTRVAMCSPASQAIDARPSRRSLGFVGSSGYNVVLISQSYLVVTTSFIVSVWNYGNVSNITWGTLCSSVGYARYTLAP